MKKKTTGDAEVLENWMKNPRVACRVIPGTNPPAVVDTFKRVPRGNLTFFLSHFHSDHYGGLSKSWNRGVVHCSTVTGRMLSRSLGVDPSYVNQLELDTEYTIGGATVTLVDANHCPGAAMLLFRTSDGRVYLHTGDFRFDPQMLQKPILRQRKIDILYLDTTYAHPEYAFVSQSESLRQAVDISKKRLIPGTPARTLYLVGAYATGKEKVAFALAEAHGCRIYASGRRRCILDCQDLTPERRALITNDAAEAHVHLVPLSTIGSVLPYFRPNFTRIQSYLQENKLVDIFSHVVGEEDSHRQFMKKLQRDSRPWCAAGIPVFYLFASVEQHVGLLPTGWSFTTKWNKEHAFAGISVFEDHVVVCSVCSTSGSAAVHLLEYSEHSSYPELRAFVLGLNPVLVVPTVFSGPKHYETLLEEWQPSKVAAQVALEKQQSTKRKRDGEAVVEDKCQRRITAFFRHKSSVDVAVNVSTVAMSSEEKKDATAKPAGGSVCGSKTPTVAAAADPTAVENSPAKASKTLSGKALAAREKVVGVASAEAVATVAVPADGVVLKIEACILDVTEERTAEGELAATRTPGTVTVDASARAQIATDSAEVVVASTSTDDCISADARRRKGNAIQDPACAFVKEGSGSFLVGSAPSDFTLKREQTESADLKRIRNTLAFPLDPFSGPSSICSGSSVSSSAESKSSGKNFDKLDQRVGSATSSNAVSTNQEKNFVNGLPAGVDGKSVTAGKSPRTPRSRLSPRQGATDTGSPHTESGSNRNNRLTLPAAWIKKKAAAPSGTTSCKDRTSGRTAESIRVKEQATLNVYLRLPSCAVLAKGESSSKHGDATCTEEVIEVSDE